MYFDQSAVNAALHGRVLVVEGLEKVERNVMPVLNNLLENRGEWSRNRIRRGSPLSSTDKVPRI